MLFKITAPSYFAVLKLKPENDLFQLGKNMGMKKNKEENIFRKH